MQPLIQDGQALVSATHNGHPLPVYDDGFGPIWLFVQSLGPVALVRAQSWEDAWAICEDEFFDEANETVEELRKEYNFDRQYIQRVLDDEGFERDVEPEDYVNGRLVPKLRGWKTLDVPCKDENGFFDNELFQEAYGVRPNGPNEKDVHKHGIYQKDLNGDHLFELIDIGTETRGIKLVIANETE